MFSKNNVCCQPSNEEFPTVTSDWCSGYLPHDLSKNGNCDNLDTIQYRCIISPTILKEKNGERPPVCEIPYI